jgi:hypothetical protein
MIQVHTTWFIREPEEKEKLATEYLVQQRIERVLQRFNGVVNILIHSIMIPTIQNNTVVRASLKKSSEVTVFGVAVRVWERGGREVSLIVTSSEITMDELLVAFQRISINSHA